MVNWFRKLDFFFSSTHRYRLCCRCIWIVTDVKSSDLLQCKDKNEKLWNCSLKNRSRIEKPERKSFRSRIVNFWMCRVICWVLVGDLYCSELFHSFHADNLFKNFFNLSSKGELLSDLKYQILQTKIICFNSDLIQMFTITLTMTANRKNMWKKLRESTHNISTIELSFHQTPATLTRQIRTTEQLPTEAPKGTWNKKASTLSLVENIPLFYRTTAAAEEMRVHKHDPYPQARGRYIKNKRKCRKNDTGKSVVCEKPQTC